MNSAELLANNVGGTKTVKSCVILSLALRPLLEEELSGVRVNDDQQSDPEPVKTFGGKLKEGYEKIDSCISLNSLKLLSYDVKVILSLKYKGKLPHE